MTLHFEDDRLALHVYVSGFSNNAWLLISKTTNRSLIIDTPAEPIELLEAAGKTDVAGILITHNHTDHLEGFRRVAEAYPVPVGIGARDAGAVERLGVTPSIDVSHGRTVTFGSLSLRAIHTPGHTPGSTCYFLDSAGRHLFSGDTLFPGGPGRTGSPASFRQIIASISAGLLTLPEDAVVHPGHGPDTSVGEARREFAEFTSRAHRDDLYGDVTWLRS